MKEFWLKFKLAFAKAIQRAKTETLLSTDVQEDKESGQVDVTLRTKLPARFRMEYKLIVKADTLTLKETFISYHPLWVRCVLSPFILFLKLAGNIIAAFRNTILFVVYGYRSSEIYIEGKTDAAAVTDALNKSTKKTVL